MIIGHQKQQQFLKGLAESGKISHAYLFVGQEKLGKKTLAEEWVRLLWKGKTEDFSPADFILIESFGQEIKIEKIRDLIHQLSFKPLNAPFKVALIDDAHLMNQEAQTCLLKTLEEPSGQSILILITDQIDKLLPAIVSRVQIIKFRAVKSEEIRNYLLKERVSPDEIEEILQLAMGRPGLAIDFLDKQKRKDFKEKINEVEKLFQASLLERFQYAKKFNQNREDLLVFLDVCLFHFRNKLLQKLAVSENRANTFSDAGFKKIKRFLEKILEIRDLIAETNINPQLTLENLLLNF